MKSCLLACILLICASAHAATGSVIYTFAGGSDGQNPDGSVVLYQGNLYGTVSGGGAGNAGQVFRAYRKKDGVYAKVALHDFIVTDGAVPAGVLALDQIGNIYGITATGGSFGLGTVFMLTRPANIADAWPLTTLWSFTGGSDGSNPSAGVSLINGSLDGTTPSGFGNSGAVFQLTQASTGIWSFQVLWQFTAAADGQLPMCTISADKDGLLYGTTFLGGINGLGTLFRLSQNLSTGVWAEEVLLSFGGELGGANQAAGGVIINPLGTVYGSSYGGGSHGSGTIYKATPNVNGIWTATVLHSFDGTTESGQPEFSLVYWKGSYYGVSTMNGGGEVFKTNPSATHKQWDLSVLQNLSLIGGDIPLAGITISNARTIYGATAQGGIASNNCGNGCGIVYKITQ